MSFPAVLYDHVPLTDIVDDDGDAQKLEPVGVSYFVSSMVHQVSAPREHEDDLDPEGEENLSRIRACDREGKDTLKVFDKESNINTGDASSTKDCASRDMNDDNKILAENDDEDDDRPMETIIEDVDSEYVIIPIPPPTSVDGCQKILAALPRSRVHKILKKLHHVLKATSKQARNGASGSVANLKTVILKPLRCYSKNFIPSSIYSSFDWVSTTVVDGSGNRLILPGSCIALDLDESQNTISENDTFNDDNNMGTLIVPACENSNGFTDESTGSRSIDKASSSPFPASIWGSNTIMVSAYDLLAAKRNRDNSARYSSSFDTINEEERGTPRHLHENYLKDTVKIMSTTQGFSKRWKRAIFKLAERNADFFYCYCRIYVRRYIRETGRLLVKSQQLWKNYYNGNPNRNFHALISTEPLQSFSCCSFDETKRKSNNDRVKSIILMGLAFDSDPQVANRKQASTDNAFNGDSDGGNKMLIEMSVLSSAKND